MLTEPDLLLVKSWKILVFGKLQRVMFRIISLYQHAAVTFATPCPARNLGQKLKGPLG